jgi:hypothetical protein
MENIIEFEETVGNKQYKVKRMMVPNIDLKFYIENPRVYSLFDRSEGDPSQEEMQQKLCTMEDVKELKGTIESNGGLLVPLIVKSGENIVLEGNRRLAAYRILSKKDPDKWKNVICDMYPEDITEDAIFILLGQCHINGQKKWAPFEEAGYLYRRIKNTGCTPAHIATELGISESEIKKRYEVYKFMIEHNDLDPNHWSYYEEYLKIKALKKARKEHPELDKKVVADIQSKTISDAKGEIREQLGKVAKISNEGNGQLMEQYINGEKSLNECASELEDVSTDTYKCINNFRTKIMDPKFKRTISNIPASETAKYVTELKTIQGTIDDLIKKLQSRKTLDEYESK